MKRILSILLLTGVSLTVLGQKLPFQGQLLENNVPVNGVRQMTFNISVDTTIQWTEMHPNVQVTEGIYSLVLGSITPLPDNLFAQVSEHQLQIQVGAEALSPITIYGGVKQWKFFGGEEHKAGWFEGDVKISGELQSDRYMGSYNPNALGAGKGDWRILMGPNYFDDNRENNGKFSIYGPRDDGEGERVQIASYGPDSKNSYGVIRVSGYGGYSKASLGAWNQSGQLVLRGENNAINTVVGEKHWEEGDQGYIQLFSERKDSTDNGVRAELMAHSTGANSWGSLSLNGPVFGSPGCPDCPRTFVWAGVRNDPNGPVPSEWSSHLDLRGQESPNILMGGKVYEDADLPFIELYGNVPDGNGWFYHQAKLEVNKRGDQQWGTLRLNATKGKTNIELGAKEWEDPTKGAGRPFLRMKGNDDTEELVWMEVFDSGGGNEEGRITLNNSGKGLSTVINSSLAHIGNGGASAIVLDGSTGNLSAVNGNFSGTVTAASVVNQSDRRLKKNITPLTQGLANTLKLQGVTYQWIDKAKPQHRQIGLIAQEVEDVYPELVHTNNEGMKSVNYSQMVAVLIEAIKELHTQMETLKAENASLTTKLTNASYNEKRIGELETNVKALMNLVKQAGNLSMADSRAVGQK